MKFLTLALLVVGIVGVTLVTVRQDGSGSDAAPVEPVVVPLPTVPLGEWECVTRKTSSPLEDRQVVSRTCYRNRRTEQVVTAVVLSGDSMDLCTHTPDVCYRGAGYSVLDPQHVRVHSRGGKVVSELNAARFKRDSHSGYSELLIFWAWLDEGRWMTVENPRIHFTAGTPMVKLYLIVENSFATGAATSGAVTEQLEPFLERFLDASYDCIDAMTDAKPTARRHGSNP